MVCEGISQGSAMVDWFTTHVPRVLTPYELPPHLCNKYPTRSTKPYPQVLLLAHGRITYEGSSQGSAMVDWFTTHVPRMHMLTPFKLPIICAINIQHHQPPPTHRCCCWPTAA